MTVSYLVFYQGEAADNAAFIKRYKTVHVPLLEKFPRILNVRVFEPAATADAHPVNAGGFLLVCEMVFADTDDLERALASPERTAARADFKKFPEFHGHIWHQAMQSGESTT